MNVMTIRLTFDPKQNLLIDKLFFLDSNKYLIIFMID